MNRYFLFVIIILFVGIGLFLIMREPPVSQNGDVPPEEPQDNLIRLTTPKPGDTVRSPLIIEGEARGNWYFEASFPVTLLDANGNVLVQHYAMAQDEWMTTEFVPFRTELTFSAPAGEEGVLVLEKDNPSGLPEHADERRIPVRFDLSNVPTRSIQLYYYNAEKDKDAAGNIQCSRDGLSAVERRIPVTQTPVQDAVRLLLKGKLTVAEKARGITTEYPLEGVALEGASLKTGTLTLAFTDPQNKTIGGACRAGILWFQIEATAKQFPEVTSVKFSPEELFQP